MKRSVLEYLEANASAYPHKVAVIDSDKQLTFEEFLMLSRHVGSAVAASTPMRRPVAVFAEKGADTLCAFMGIVQAGCFYCLLNPEFPMNRLTQILSVLKPELLITDEAHKNLAFALVKEICTEPEHCKKAQTEIQQEGHQEAGHEVQLEEQQKAWMSKDRILLIEDMLTAPINSSLLTDRRKRAVDTDPLYVNFTSGSTGTPKGVLISQRSVLDFIEVFVPLFGIDSTDIIGNQAPFDFDVSVKDIYSAMKTGATLVIIPKALFSKPAMLLDHLCEMKITTMIWAVSALCLITTCHGLDYKVPVDVRRVLFSGEVMPQKHLHAWMAKLPEASFVNLYGPTEITCNCTYYCLDRKRDYRDGIPIGQAFVNEDVFLLSEDQKLIDGPGRVGEICVRGSALALGYYGDPGQTAKAFPQNPLNPWFPERIYRTGDLARYIEDRNLVFCGRKDFQIKYKGHRIELEEIEWAVSALTGVERCCVIFDEKKQKLYGFYIGSIDKKQLYGALKRTLPIYMVPGALRQLERFPLTKNGKTDRRRLLEEA